MVVIINEMESETSVKPVGDLLKSNVLNSDDKKRKAVNNDSPSKKKAKFGRDLYKQPTVEELNELRETENLFQSNLIRLQIEELLNSVKIKEKYKNLFIKSWFDVFVKQLKNIECNEKFEVS